MTDIPVPLAVTKAECMESSFDATAKVARVVFRLRNSSETFALPLTVLNAEAFDVGKWYSVMIHETV